MSVPDQSSPWVEPDMGYFCLELDPDRTTLTEGPYPLPGLVTETPDLLSGLVTDGMSSPDASSSELKGGVLKEKDMFLTLTHI